MEHAAALNVAVMTYCRTVITVAVVANFATTVIATAITATTEATANARESPAALARAALTCAQSVSDAATSLPHKCLQCWVAIA